MTELPGWVVPEHWTPDEAIVVHELLEELIAAVWRAHGPAITQRYAELRGASPRPPDPEEDLPF